MNWKIATDPLKTTWYLRERYDNFERADLARFDPTEKRDSHGRWTKTGGFISDASKLNTPFVKEGPPFVDVGSDLNKAAKLIAQGKRVQLDQPDQVATLVQKLGKMAEDAQKKGKKAPLYDLCNVTVKNTNLFCLQTKDIPRVDMPQLAAPAPKGSRADRELPKDARGEVDLTPLLLAELKKKGYKETKGLAAASHLRATQNELNGAKVAGIMNFFESGKAGSAMDIPLIISKDNYVVDGHHRWAAQVGEDTKDGHLGDVKVPVVKIDVDIGTLLDMANKLQEAYGIPHQSAKVNKVLTGK